MPKYLLLSDGHWSLRLCPTEIETILRAAGPTLRAMSLLGINAGLGNQDVALLRRKNLDLKTGWLDFPRPKTGVQRRCPLWPETVALLKALRKRQPCADDEPLFVLRANDELAPEMVERWALRYADAKRAESGFLTDAQERKYKDAMAIAHAMRVWKARRTA